MANRTVELPTAKTVVFNFAETRSDWGGQIDHNVYWRRFSMSLSIGVAYS